MSWQERRVIDDRSVLRRVDDVDRNELRAEREDVYFGVDRTILSRDAIDRFARFATPEFEFEDGNAVVCRVDAERIGFSAVRFVWNREYADDFVTVLAKTLVDFGAEVRLTDDCDAEGRHDTWRSGEQSTHSREEKKGVTGV